MANDDMHTMCTPKRVQIRCDTIYTICLIPLYINSWFKPISRDTLYVVYLSFLLSLLLIIIQLFVVSYIHYAFFDFLSTFISNLFSYLIRMKGRSRCPLSIYGNSCVSLKYHCTYILHHQFINYYSYCVAYLLITFIGTLFVGNEKNILETLIDFLLWDPSCRSRFQLFSFHLKQKTFAIKVCYTIILINNKLNWWCKLKKKYLYKNCCK